MDIARRSEEDFLQPEHQHVSVDVHKLNGNGQIFDIQATRLPDKPGPYMFAPDIGKPPLCPDSTPIASPTLISMTSVHRNMCSTPGPSAMLFIVGTHPRY